MRCPPGRVLRSLSLAKKKPQLCSQTLHGNFISRNGGRRPRPANARIHNQPDRQPDGHQPEHREGFLTVRYILDRSFESVRYSGENPATLKKSLYGSALLLSRFVVGWRRSYIGNGCKSLGGVIPMQSETKRRNRRYLIGGDFQGSELPAFQAPKKPGVFCGQVKDISDGGFCLVAGRRPEQSVLLQGLLRVAQMPTKIPTLVQVRWVNRQLRRRRYRIGLQYVI